MSATAAILIGAIAGAIAAKLLVALCRLALLLAAKLAQPSAAMIINDLASDRDAERLGRGDERAAVHSKEIAR